MEQQQCRLPCGHHYVRLIRRPHPRGDVDVDVIDPAALIIQSSQFQKGAS